MSDGTGSSRIYSLDVFRGATIAGMILVNNPGTWSAIYPPLQHAEWHGLTPTDLIFPFFLFIVGVAIAIALGKRVSESDNRAVYIKIFRRTALIFGLGLLLHAFPFFELSTLRIPGVLQRIAVCYLIASLIFLNTTWKQQGIIAGALLLGYWFLMTAVNVPGCEVTALADKACNLAAYVDRSVLGLDHIWKQGKVYDPEGILSTIPAVVTTMSGVFAGLWLKTDKGEYEKAGGLLLSGIVLLVIGWIWSFWFPFNKALWTSSYTVYTSGLACCFLGFCYWVNDLKGYKTWAKPLEVFGVNALALYVGSGIAAKLLDIIKVGGGPDAMPLKAWFYDSLATVFEPINASLAFALLFVGVWLGIMWILYWKRIYIKV